MKIVFIVVIILNVIRLPGPPAPPPLESSDGAVLLYDDLGCDGVSDGGAIATQDTIGDGQYLFESLSLGPAASPICFVAEVDTSDPDLGACTIPDTPMRRPNHHT